MQATPAVRVQDVAHLPSAGWLRSTTIRVRLIAGKTMEEIVDAVEKVTELIGEIAASSHEQSGGIRQVHAAVTQMDQVVQQNASLVEQASAATESMKEQAGTLLQLVSRFKLAAMAGARLAVR